MKCHKVEINYRDHLQCQSVRRGGNCHDRRIGNGRDVTLKGIYKVNVTESLAEDGSAVQTSGVATGIARSTIVGR